MGSSLLNILTVWMDESTRVYAGPGAFLLNSLYFAVTLAMTFFVTLYLLMRVLEFSSKKRDLAVALALLAAAAAVYLVVLVLNARTGWLFYFDDLGDYRRGPLNKTPHLAPVFQIAVIAWCYLRHRDTISRAVANVASSVPALAIVLIALQFLFPDLYLTGTFAATVNLVLYLNFQSCKIEQDPLTGLGSRSSFVTELRHRLSKGQGFQALLVSMRNFSEINQVYGHGAGDAVLLQVSQRLEGLVEGGFAYRFGGDQFAALLSPLPSAQREARLHGIVSALRSPWVATAMRCGSAWRRRSSPTTGRTGLRRTSSTASSSRRRSRARRASSSRASTRRRRPGTTSARSSSAACIGRSRKTASRSDTSRSIAPRAAASRRPRPCFACAATTAGSSRPRSSSHWSRRPVSSTTSPGSSSTGSATFCRRAAPRSCARSR